MTEETSLEPLSPPNPEAAARAMQHNPHLRMEALKLAQQLTLENIRNRPADQREITSDDITAMADKLMGYVAQ